LVYEGAKMAKAIMKLVVKKIALERIYRLFELAERNFKKHPERSKRYIELARKIAMRYNVRIPFELKQKFCKKCNAFLKAGVNAKIRVSKHIIKVTCLECNYTRKIGKKVKSRKKGARKNLARSRR